MTRAVVVGDVMLDVVTRPAGPVAATSDTPAQTRVGRGGSSANVAVALAAAGVAVVHVGAVGRDAAADLLAADLAAHGVTARWERREGPTGVVVAVVAPDGQRAMLTDRGANPRLSAAFVEAAIAEGADHVHVSGYTVLDPATRAVAARALALARRDGAGASVDVCSVAPLREVGAAAFLAAAAGAGTLFANEEEALALTGAPDAEGAEARLAELFDEVVLTRGALGARARRAGEGWATSSQVADVVDTTGAGDAATGAYLGARLLGAGPGEALERAMAAAALVIASLGRLTYSRR